MPNPLKQCPRCGWRERAETCRQCAVAMVALHRRIAADLYDSEQDAFARKRGAKSIDEILDDPRRTH